MKSRIADGSLISVLNRIQVRKGDIFYIKSGTLHAIGPGITLAEIQQNSPLTFRVFDYQRVDKNGKQRELHIKEALDCMSLNCGLPYSQPELLKAGDGYQIYKMVRCSRFNADIYRITKSAKIEGKADKWQGVLITDGEITFRNLEGEETIIGKKGDFFLIPRNSDKYELSGEAEFILVE